MAFTDRIVVMTAIQMDGSNHDITFPSGCKTHTINAKDGAIVIIDDSSNEFQLDQGQKITFDDPNLAGKTISVTGTAPAYAQMLSQRGLCS